MTTTNAQAIASKGLQITAFHKDVFSIIATANRAATKAGETMSVKLFDLLGSRYGAVAPTFAQFKIDRAALKELAKAKGLTDDQYYRKAFNAAVIAKFGALPEAQTESAIAKREARGRNQAKKEATPAKRRDVETVEQYIARVGIWKILETCTAMLAADESTAATAKAIAKVAKAA